VLGAWSVAWGGEVELAVERGWAEYDRERFPEARALARQALEGQPGHPGARGLYVEATAASGWGGVGSLELGGAAGAEPWAEFEAAFAAHVAASDKKAIKADVLQVQTQWPDAPDLLRPLWAADAGPALSARSRWAALTRPATWSPEALLRWDRLAGDLDAPGLQEAVDAAIREKDLARPQPKDHFALRALGQEWSEHPLAGPPPVLPSELAVSAGHLDELWTKAARWDELQAFWTSATTLADDAHPHERKAAAHLAEGKAAEAATDLDAAFARLGAPRPSDQPALATERIRAEVVRVLRTRAAAARAREDVASARGDLGTAILLGEEQVDGPLADELEHLAVGYELQLEPKYRSRKQTPAELAVGRALALPAPAAGAEAAAVQKATDEQLALAREARFLALSGMGTGKPLATDPEAWREVVGDTWYVEGRAHALAGRHAEARAAFVVASLLLADDAELWDRRAAEHAALGETDAAFAALAVARGKGAPATEERLAATYRGPGDALTIARAIGGDHVGIAHTRWATHGGVTRANAHPHADTERRIAVVHNGIIENIDRHLGAPEAEGVVFRSETDTEVIPHLIARTTPATRLRPCAGARQVRGTYGIAVVFADHPDLIVPPATARPWSSGWAKARTSSRDPHAVVGTPAG
jgi:hypothetical protein